MGISSPPTIPPLLPAPILALRGHVEWLSQPGTQRLLGLVGTYIEERRHIVGYAQGALRLQGGVLAGEAAQYFSDRTYKLPPAPTGGFDTRPDFPFNSGATDKLGFSIDPNTAVAKLVLLSWGSGTTEVKLEFQHGVFYAFPPGGGMHAIVLNRVDNTIR